MINMAQKQKHIFSPNKPLIEIYDKVDSEGNEIDVREDVEQQVKYQEILESLFSAGYYRAQVQGIQPFDKIVGGMTWCIEICNIDIDVNLLFEENLTIGKKISLTEKIVAVLPSLGCPYNIEPHQIQGLDFIKLQPLIQWLIKHSDEFRQENEDVLRRFAVAQYDKSYIFEADRERCYKEKCMIRNILNVKNLYKPSRLKKRNGPLPKNQLEQVISTLSEYDQRMVIQKPPTSNNENNEDLDFLYDIEKSLADSTKLTVLEDRVTHIDEKSTKEISEAKIHYAMLESELTGDSNQSEALEHQKLLEEVDRLQIEVKQAEAAMSQCRESHNEKIEMFRDSILSKKTELRDLKQCLVDLFSLDDEELSPQDVKELIIELKSLIKERNELNQVINAKMKQFQQLQNYYDEIKEQIANPTTDNLTPEEIKQFDEIESQLNAHLAELKAPLNKLIREVNSLMETIDDIPSQNELLHYEKRFLQLYEQVAEKHKETKQYYVQYNTLCDVKFYVSKELSLLNSIMENYKEAMSSPKKLDQFMTQIKSILEWVQQTAKKMSTKYENEQKKSEQLNHEYFHLLEIEREYQDTLKCLAEERKKLRSYMNRE